MATATADNAPLQATQAVFAETPAWKEHQLPYAADGAARAARKHRREKHTASSGQDSSCSNSESEDDSWTRWEGLKFSLAQGLGPGVRLCSDYFEVAGQLWRLEVYPAGVSAEAAHHLSLFLTTPGSDASANQVLHKIVIVDQSGKGHHVTKSKSRVPGHLLASRGIVAAYPKAVKLGYLTRHAKHYLLHDTVLIRTTVQIVRSWSYDVPPSVSYQSDVYSGMQAGMHDDLQQSQAAPNISDLQHW